MKKRVIIPLAIMFLIGCTTIYKEQYDEYENSIHIGNNITRIDKDFKYIGNLSLIRDYEILDGTTPTAPLESSEHFFINVNPNNKIDKFIVVYSYIAKDPTTQWRGEVDYKMGKTYQSRMHLGTIKVNDTQCASVVKKWSYAGERYVKFAKEKGYEFDQSKHCLIESRIGKTTGRSTIMHVSYFESLDSCQNIRNVENENSKIVQEMFSKLQSNVNIKW
jgi:hypothetical protein